jgi:hypothetical protein
MEVAALAPGLWRWTAPHPAWTPADEGEWDQIVGCVYCEVDGGIALIDPLVPAEDAGREQFWRALDSDAERLGAPLVLVTCSDHGRSSAEIVERYGAAGRSVRDVVGVQLIRTARYDESVYWLEPYRALVAGDVLIGDEAGGVRVCPDDWLDKGTRDAVWASLRPLLELPVERVLVSHGEPVLAGGRAALARALRDER